MPTIRILDTLTTQSIAAGEVVERPASVVKELCENSIDAGANRLQIYIEQGGIKSIRISDNGSGMSFEDAKMAFADHATSKIRALSDLDSLMTLGFRGEALPTIAAVSKVTLLTRRPEDETGTKISLAGGELKEHCPWPCNEGTTIEVRDIFFNTPARFKFLKKDQTEAARITETVQDLALSRPDISFYLENQGKEVLHTPGDNQLISAIYAIFGQQMAKSMVPILPPAGAGERMITCEGYLSLPEQSRKSRNWQLFFVNGRPIKAPVITRALEDAYKSTLMTGRFPAAVIKLNLPMNLVDVNVHPRKLEVRFWNEGEVYRSVYEQVQNSLFTALRPPKLEGGAAAGEQADEKKMFTEPEPESDSESPGRRAEERAEAKAAFRRSLSAPVRDEENRPILHFDLGGFAATPFGEHKEKYQAARVTDLPIRGTGTYEAAVNKTSEASAAEAENNEKLAPSAEEQAGAEQLSFVPDEAAAGTDPVLLALSKARYAGQLFRTYLLFELAETVYVIDQHAAHEKILFEEAVRDYGKNKRIASQMLLEPLSCEVSSAEAIFIEENKEIWPALGFELDFFGRNKLLLRAMPIGPGYLDPVKTFRSFLDEAMAEGAEHIKGNSDLIYHLLATDSCKAAVKAHDRLSPAEVEALREQLLKLSNPYHCPHGRPVIIEVQQRELEKLFKRIV